MELRFGAPLIARGDAHIGAIHRVVLDSETQRLRAVTMRIGHLFSRERVVGARYLRELEDREGIGVDLDAADAAHLPLLAPDETGEPPGSRDHVHPYTSWTGGETTLTGFIGSAAVNRRALPVFEKPDADRDVTLVDAHTTVHGPGGERIGSVSAIICDRSGTAVGMLVKRAGIFRSGEIYVPTDHAHYTGDAGHTFGLEWRE